VKEDDRYQRGREVAWQLWGKAIFESREPFFEAMEQSSSESSAKFMELALFSFTNYANPVVDLKTRCLIQIAALTALGQLEELKMYVIAALNAGATEEEVTETLDQLILYCGLSRVRGALITARRAFTEQKAMASTGEE
jgi:alkylhydroperoxidase/carboxymuconolactone decarboxylase family protein YurZ